MVNTNEKFYAHHPCNTTVPTSAPPQSEGKNPAQPTPQQRPLPLRPDPLEVLRPLPELILPVELVPGDEAGGSVSSCSPTMAISSSNIGSWTSVLSSVVPVSGS